VMTPAGPEKAVGVITVGFVKDPTDPQWDKDPAMKEWRAFMKKYYPTGDLTDWYNVYAYAVAQTLVQVLKQCGDDLTRENVMRQAANLKDVVLDLGLPGMKINTGPNDYRVNKQLQMMKFNGERWELFGPIMEDAGPAG
jgi:branched-chain amino acid transport system substrate-binding protein